MTARIFEIAGLSVEISGYAYQRADNYHDANWYRVAAKCVAPGASVKVSGAILMAPDLFGFADELRVLIDKGSGSAKLTSFEPNLHVEIRISSLGTGVCSVEITPDNVWQAHRIDFSIDQTFLGPLLAACEQILNEYPVRAA